MAERKEVEGRGKGWENAAVATVASRAGISHSPLPSEGDLLKEA